MSHVPYAAYEQGTPQLDLHRSGFGHALPHDVHACVGGHIYTTHRGRAACSGTAVSYRKPWGRTLQQIHAEELHRARHYVPPSPSQDSGKGMPRL